MNTGLFLKPCVPQRRGMGAVLCTGTTHPSTFLPPKSQNLIPGREVVCAGARVGSCAVSAGCSPARTQADLPPVCAISKKPCSSFWPPRVLLGWAVHCFLALSPRLCRQWNGLADPSKVNTAGDIPWVPPRHSIPGVGGWASMHLRGSWVQPWCFAPRQGAGKRALNVVEKLAAVGNSVSGKCSNSGAVFCTVVRPGAELQLLLLPLQIAHCKLCLWWRNWEHIHQYWGSTNK